MTNKLLRTVGRLALAGMLSLFAVPASAQSAPWPARPIRFIVALPPGGGPDLLARLLAERLQPVLGQPLVVENRPGAGGNIGAEIVARAAPDGHTLLLSTSAQAVNAAMGTKLSYDILRDFEPITLAADIPFVLTVNTSLPVRNMKEFLAWAKAHPGATYGSAGMGTPHHLAAEMMRTMTGLQLVHIPYKGAAQIVPALLSSEINFSIASVSSLVPYYKTDKLRPIAVATAARTPLLPDVPTIAEAGGLPGYAIDVWFGVVAPAGTPRPVVNRLNAEINRVVRDPQVIKERLEPAGLASLGTTPERYMEVIKADMAKYEKLIREAKIKPE
jgi:tripartite-type tricarboxylate transporter receptor subunit TctC